MWQETSQKHKNRYITSWLEGIKINAQVTPNLQKIGVERNDSKNFAQQKQT